VLVADPDRLRYRPRAAVPAHLHNALVEHAAEVQHLLLAREGRSQSVARPARTTCDDLHWRVEAMLLQVPRIGPIRGLLTSREGGWPADGHHCVSCGDALPANEISSGPLGSTVRCDFCHEAAWLAIERGRQR